MKNFFSNMREAINKRLVSKSDNNIFLNEKVLSQDKLNCDFEQIYTEMGA